jgi:hypothetical protein
MRLSRTLLTAPLALLSFHATVPVNYATMIYTYGEANPAAARAAWNFAIRDTIEQAAAAFCSGPRDARAGGGR